MNEGFDLFDLNQRGIVFFFPAETYNCDGALFREVGRAHFSGFFFSLGWQKKKQGGKLSP